MFFGKGSDMSRKQPDVTRRGLIETGGEQSEAGLDCKTPNGIRRGLTETRGEQSEAGFDRKGPNGTRRGPRGDLGGTYFAQPPLTAANRR